MCQLRLDFLTFELPRPDNTGRCTAQVTFHIQVKPVVGPGLGRDKEEMEFLPKTMLVVTFDLLFKLKFSRKVLMRYFY